MFTTERHPQNCQATPWMSKINTVFAWISAPCGCKLGIFSEVGVLAIFRFTAPLNDCRSERNGRYCTFALSLFNLLRRSQLVKRMLIVQNYDHAANMNSESTKELLKWRNFSAGLHTRQEERYVTLRFLLLLGGSFTSFFYDNCASHSPSNREKLGRGGGGALI